MEKYKNRGEVPEKYKWDLKEYYKNDETFEKSFKKVLPKIKKIKKYIGCTKDSNKLLEYLKFDKEVSCELENLYVYSFVKDDEELGKSVNIERKNKVIKSYSDYEIASNFFAPEILKLDKKSYEDLFNNEELKIYKNALDKIYRNKSHILDEEKENIITNIETAVDHFSDTSSTMLNSEHDYGTIKIDGENHEITSTNYRIYLKNKDKSIRKEVYEKYNKKLSEYNKTSAALLNGYVTLNNTDAKIHNFKNAWDRKLFSLNINEKVFKALVSSVEDNLDVLQKYYKLKKEELNLDKLYPYDLSLKISNNDKEYSIEEGTSLIRKALEPLGEKYLEKYDNVVNKRYIDYCCYKGKCSGGYNISTHTKNSRILMSYNYDLQSISTIAHESGHNVNHQFMMDNNEVIYRDNSNIVAEVASLTNECLLSSYLSEHGTTKSEKLDGIENILEVIVSNLYGAVREGKIEEDFYKKVDAGGTLTSDYLDFLSIESLKKYYGDTVEIDDYLKNGWVRRSHYYMNYYLYSYAISISVATYVAKEILDGNKNMLDKYLEFLSVGSNKWPYEAFEVLGIDLREKQVYENGIKYFNNLIEKYKKIKKEV